jgi:uncharacterized protein involved in type VI secretion and phage assembly
MSHSLEILVEGSALSDENKQAVVDIRVELGIGAPDRATVRFSDPHLKMIDGSPIDVGNKLEIKMGLSESGDMLVSDLNQIASAAPTSVFKGEVVAIEGDLGHLGNLVVVTAFDKSHRMRRNLKTKAFTDVTVSDIAGAVASSAGLTVGTCDAEGGTRKDVLQHGESDWALLQRLCDEADCDIEIDDGTLNLIKRTAGSGPVATLTWAHNLRAFRPRLSGVAQVETVHVRAWDPDQKQAIDGQAQPKAPVAAQNSIRDTASSALGGGDIVIVDHPVESAALATAAAKAAADRLASTVVEATGVASGTPALKPGAVVELDGVGKRFGGEHRIVAVTHVMGAEFETRFTLGAGGRPLVAEFGGRPRSNGFASQLAIGVVTNNSDGDGNLGRVKVKYPVLDDQTESVWARIAWPAAGAARGIVAIPEVGDEVLIGFEGGDIERPFVLGVLFNGQEKPGDDLLAKSSSVAVVMPRDLTTKTDGKVTTTAKQDITVESSQGGITIKSDQGGFKVTSAQNIELTSQQGEVKTSGMSGTTIQDTGSITINGTAGITIQSDANISISAPAITVSADGDLELSGAMVMIG